MPKDRTHAHEPPHAPCLRPPILTTITITTITTTITITTTQLPTLPTRPAPAPTRQHTASMGLGPW